MKQTNNTKTETLIKHAVIKGYTIKFIRVVSPEGVGYMVRVYNNHHFKSRLNYYSYILPENKALVIYGDCIKSIRSSAKELCEVSIR